MTFYHSQFDRNLIPTLGRLKKEYFFNEIENRSHPPTAILRAKPLDYFTAEAISRNFMRLIVKVSRNNSREGEVTEETGDELDEEYNKVGVT